MKSYLLLIASLIFIHPLLHAQDGENKPVIKFGLAATLETNSDVFEDGFHRNSGIGFSKILLPVIIKSRIKIEPEISYRSRDANSSLDYKLWQFGLGGYYFFPYNEINIYFGPGFGFEKLTSVIYSTNDEAVTTTTYNYGVAFGAEYFLSRHFSTGIEARVNRYFSNGTGNFDIKITHLAIIPRIYLGVYFQ